MSSVVGNSNFQIFPLNKKQSYSFRSGGSQLIFTIPESDSLMVDPSSLRLNFTVRLLKGGTNISQAPTPGGSGLQGRVANTDWLAGVVGRNAVPGVASVAVQHFSSINSKAGVQTLIDSVTIRSAKNNSQIEQSRFYNRLAASVIPATLSQDDYNSFAGITFGAFGARDYSEETSVDSDIMVSTNIISGLTSQKGLWNLKALGGVRLDLHLASDSSCLFGDSAKAAGGDFYELRNVSMTGIYKILDEPLSGQQEPMVYNNYQSFTTVLNSSDDTTNLNLALGEVLSVWNNSLPAVLNNNYLYDGMAAYPLMQSTAGPGTLGVELEDICHIVDSIITRDSVKFPADYQISERVVQRQQKIPRGAGTLSYEPLDALRNWNFTNSIKSWERNSHSVMSATTAGVGTASGPSIDPAGVGDPSIPGNVPAARAANRPLSLAANRLYGWGSRMDISDSNAGIDYSNATYSQRIISNLNTGTDPQLIYSFALCKNTLMSTPSGPVVSA